MADLTIFKHIHVFELIRRLCYNYDCSNGITRHSQLRKFMTFKRIGVMVFNATFNNISAISWQSVVLLEEIGVP